MDRVEFILRQLHGNVLDVGCSAGTLHERIQEKIPLQDRYAIDTEVKPEKENEQYKKADAEKHIPFENEFFDCVLAGELIEHLHEPEKFLQESKRVLKPKGKLIITTPNRNSFVNRLFKSYHAPLHFTLFAKKELIELLEKNEFAIEYFYCQPYTEESCSGSHAKWVFPFRKVLHYFLPQALQENMIVVAQKVA